MTREPAPTDSQQRPHTIWAGVHHTLRSDVTAGVLLMAATMAALVLANSPAAVIYENLRDYTVGPVPLHLHLTLGAWAAEGLLAIFFFVVGLELKEELVVGKLRDPGPQLYRLLPRSLGWRHPRWCLWQSTAMLAAKYSMVGQFRRQPTSLSPLP